MLTHATGLPTAGNFQDWAWRTLIVETVTRLVGQVGGVLVLAQTVLVEAPIEIAANIAAAVTPDPVCPPPTDHGAQASVYSVSPKSATTRNLPPNAST
ncbi:hypothetical protein [Microbispora bryophytorum]|uniref:Uncharacterized protein n=1 Tax=Microbispora bryophytorum TaxID=1460882 RepID=A0A8H9GZI4_9ACTN|nr:hypothetical protein [Microbispora bryophytorum]MBD3138972.1 hypothetical protein [Microbispora bryophytorum]TQS10220.1 hypothetical protein FLX07_04220 [Microbispora bryophytorum]GGO01179.1 hypothetical protein GCM10011574_08720 [Microbispora bryophytorum]